VKSSADLTKKVSNLFYMVYIFAKNLEKKVVAFMVSFLNSKVQLLSPYIVKVKISTGAGDLSTV